jgi:acetyltransferase-like isoleucine patch superfamily enzyme
MLHRSPWAARKDLTFFTKFNKQYAAHQIGDWTYGKPNIVWGDEGATVRIGRFCSFATGVMILMGSEHCIDWVSTYPFNILFERAKSMPLPSRTKGDVVIGHDVWFGTDALILSGVTIGNGAVIAARSVVTRDVAPYSIVAGVPARHVRFRFDPAMIEALQKIAWWDWPLPKIEEALPLFMSSDLKAFIERYGSSQAHGA